MKKKPKQSTSRAKRRHPTVAGGAVQRADGSSIARVKINAPKRDAAKNGDTANDQERREFENRIYQEGMLVFDLSRDEWSITHFPNNEPPAVIVKHASGHQVAAAGPNLDAVIAAAVLKIWDEKLKRSRPPLDTPLPPDAFAEELKLKLKPRFDKVARGLDYVETYKQVKKLNCWPRLLRETCLAFYRANHKVIPKTRSECLIAEVEHFIVEVKREGRAAFPDFNDRVAHLRRIGMSEWAMRARDAAKNFVSSPPPGEAGERGLRVFLATLWLPASLWMLDNGTIARALPFLCNSKNSEKDFILGKWGNLSTQEGRDSLQGQDIGRLRRELKLPSAEDFVGVPCAEFDNIKGLHRINWPRLKSAQAGGVKVQS